MKENRTELVVGAILVAAVLLAGAAFRGCGKWAGVAAKAVDGAGSVAVAVAKSLNEGNITTSFRSSLANLKSTGGDILEVAVFENDEQFSKEDSRTILKVPAGTTSAEIRAKVTTRYHLLLSDPWQLHVRSNVCVVLAPRYRPTLPPAIHTDTLQERAENGWARFNKLEVLEELRKGMTETLSQRAADPAHMELVREQSRKSVGEFVRNWLLKEDHWKQDRFSAVVVLFPGEYPDAQPLHIEQLDRRPTIRLDQL